MHLVREEEKDSFMKVLEEEYHRKHGFSEEQIKQGLFASKPSAGACYFEGLVFCSVCSHIVTFFPDWGRFYYGPIFSTLWTYYIIASRIRT